MLVGAVRGRSQRHPVYQIEMPAGGSLSHASSAWLRYRAQFSKLSASVVVYVELCVVWCSVVSSRWEANWS